MTKAEKIERIIQVLNKHENAIRLSDGYAYYCDCDNDDIEGAVKDVLADIASQILNEIDNEEN